MMGEQLSIFVDESKESKSDVDNDFKISLDSEDYGVEYGDIYILGNHRLMCGSATNRDDVLKLIGDDKVDLIFTDPPYGINVVQNNAVGSKRFIGVAKKGKYEEIIADDTTDTARLSYDVLKDISKRVILWGGTTLLTSCPLVKIG